jgi:hypothetical protein
MKRGFCSDDELRRSQHCNACGPSGQPVTRPALSKRTRALNVEVQLCRSAVAICRQPSTHPSEKNLGKGFVPYRHMSAIRRS